MTDFAMRRRAMIRSSAVVLFASLCVLRADTLTLRDGTTVTGAWVGVDALHVNFRVNDQLHGYSRADVLTVTFGAPAFAPAQAPPAVKITRSETHRACGCQTCREATAAIPRQISKERRTPDQVIAVFGKPQSITKTDTGEIYVYKYLKVIFVGGKLSEVQ